LQYQFEDSQADPRQTVAIATRQMFDQFGTERAATRDGLAMIKDAPSVIFGKAAFDLQTRRVAGVSAVYLVVRAGKFAP
jgi:branched-chain amino acid transport system substrate-binding protein